MRMTVLTLVCCALVFGQSDAKLSFEVATIKPAPPLGGGAVQIGMRGGPGTQDPGRVNYMGVPLTMLLQNAFGLKRYQISGPPWLDTERFDIVAKVPDGATKEQSNIMLQNLLIERFGLTFHRESKEFPLYELTVAKNGSKLKTAAEAPAGADQPVPGQTGKDGGPPPIGKDGLPQLPPGRPGAFMMMAPGGMRMVGNMRTVQEIADMLGNQLGTPVVDKTGLSGKYDFTLTFSREPGQGLPGLPPPPPPPPGGDAGPGKLGPGPDLSDAANLFTAVQEQLGLKLDKKKGPLDVLVIDHMEKTPTEN
ncbi:MAG: TIGR03435 family protein [Bryobacterales bacterium]|nr:TIGR03435 family protein [Bryobacterales bacterium]MBV9397801.1 TIGR03435 family protein [Bryobacterales bacterium]